MEAFPSEITSSDGILIRQRQVQSMCRCLNKNSYYISPLPEGKRVLHSKRDQGGWKPSASELEAVPKSLMGDEDPLYLLNCFLLCCFYRNLRTFTMPFKQIGADKSNNSSADFYLTRPFNLGGCFGCPHTTYLEFPNDNGKLAVGKVEEDWHLGKNYIWRCLQAGLCCKFYYDLMVVEEGRHGEAFEFIPRYQLEVSTCCCGPHNNFLGSSCFNNDMLWNVYQYENGSSSRTNKVPAGYLQKTYAPGSEKCCSNFSNYLIEFPQEANEVWKGVFIAAFLNTEYVHFERF